MIETSAQVEYYPIKWIYIFAGGGISPNNYNNFSILPVLMSGAGIKHSDRIWSQSLDFGVHYINSSLYCLAQLKLIKNLTIGSRYRNNGLLIKAKAL